MNQVQYSQIEENHVARTNHDIAVDTGGHDYLQSTAEDCSK